MSGHGHGECHICTAHDDYCLLQCADGRELDCRMLRLAEGVKKQPRPEWIEETVVADNADNDKPSCSNKEDA